MGYEKIKKQSGFIDMIKPVLKIELPKDLSDHDIAKLTLLIKEHSVSEQYHAMVIRGNSDFLSVDIITAQDIKLHQDGLR